jgi:hypothetical protein
MAFRFGTLTTVLIVQVEKQYTASRRRNRRCRRVACVPVNYIYMPTTLDKLKQLTAHDVAPVLSDDDLDAVLAIAAVTDAAGLDPLNEEWTPSYDLNAAAAQAWLIKAGRAAAETEIEEGVVTSKVFDNCRTMARIYKSRRCVTVPIR